MFIPDSVKEWLISSNPWVEYNTRVNLLNQNPTKSEVIDARNKMINHPFVSEILNELEEWPGYALKRHNDAKHLSHKLALLADFGLKASDHLTLSKTAEKVFQDQADDGMFQILINVPTHFGGSGKDEKAWMLCDSPTVLYSLIKLGYDDKRTDKAIQYMTGLIRDNGWPCKANERFGKFKGPGKRIDPCPYANLISLKILANHKKWIDSDIAKVGAETLLTLWTQRKEKKPFLFGMGTDFKKLKTPFIWYDILHVTSVLTRFKWLKDDERLLEMINIIKEKTDDNGFYKAESVWRAYKDWDFGQKREPSPWITYSVYNILNKSNE
ncbi:MAG: hypothetical protein FK733_18950 [Asgard group archaeon]|nr:hypothetical protein [Asgard group archaeon]